MLINRKRGRRALQGIQIDISKSSKQQATSREALLFPYILCRLPNVKAGCTHTKGRAALIPVSHRESNPESYSWFKQHTPDSHRPPKPHLWALDTGRTSRYKPQQTVYIGMSYYSPRMSKYSSEKRYQYLSPGKIFYKGKMEYQWHFFFEIKIKLK